MSIILAWRRALLCSVMALAAVTASAQTVPAAAPAPAPQSITVVLDDNYPPYMFRDSSGDLQGILKDTWALWQHSTGISVKLVALDWADAQFEMAAGHADVIDTLFKTPQRQKIYDFTAPYARIEVSLYFHHSISGIVNARSVRGFTVGVKDGDACIDVLKSGGVTDFKRYPGYSAVIAAAAAGDVRVFCMDQPPAAYLLNQRGIADEFRHSAPIAVGEFHRAVRQGNAALLATVAGGFAAISVADYQGIDEKWMGAAIHPVYQSPTVRYAGWGLLAVAVLTWLLTLWNLTLRRRVQEKTRSLTASVAALDQSRQTLEHTLAVQKAMLDNDMIGIIRLSNRVVVWTNLAFERMSGYGRADLIGQPTSRFYQTQADYQKMAEAYPVMTRGDIYRTQTRFVRGNGQCIWIDVSGAMLATGSGESLWVFLDITERRLAQEAREAEAQRLHKLANRVPGLVFQYLLRPDGSSCFPFASEAIHEIYQLSPQQAQQDAAVVFTRGHPDDIQPAIDTIAESARNLTPWQHEYRVIKDDGSVRWLFGNSLPERLEDGSTLWHGFITDITERKAADERLRQLSRSVEQAPVAIVITDLDGCILYANPRFTRNTGYTLAEAMGKNPRILKSGLTLPEVYVELWNTLCQGHVWQGELHNRKKNGELFIEHAIIAPVLDANGNTSHYVAVKDDITQRKQAERALQTSLQEKVALLHEVHHRVKNNLQVITSLLRLEARRCQQPDTQAVLRDMQGRILAMALLHETLYRTDSFASVDLAAYLKQLATQAFRAQSSQGHAIRLALDLKPVQVVMDQATPCGLLVNELISNCFKHAFADGRPGEVRVQLQPAAAAGMWHLGVHDNGVGLPADFELRRQQSLGLQLASDLARQLGGTLQVGSASGTVFSVTFALAEIKP